MTVVQHPRRRGLPALREARAAARRAAERPGVRFARGAQTGDFRPDTRPPLVAGRVAVVVWADDRTALDAARDALEGPLTRHADESWHLVLEPVKVHGESFGFQPVANGARPFDPHEPMVAMISGIVKARYFPRFVRDNAEVVRQLEQTPGYLGGIGLSDTPLTTTSLSCWRTVREAQQFAFAAGAHRTAYKIDLAEQRHRTEFWIRFRPLTSEGTLAGRDPLASVLATA